MGLLHQERPVGCLKYIQRHTTTIWCAFSQWNFPGFSRWNPRWLGGWQRQGPQRGQELNEWNESTNLIQLTKFPWKRAWKCWNYFDWAQNCSRTVGCLSLSPSPRVFQWTCRWPCLRTSTILGQLRFPFWMGILHPSEQQEKNYGWHLLS